MGAKRSESMEMALIECLSYVDTHTCASYCCFTLFDDAKNVEWSVFFSFLCLVRLIILIINENVDN